jgi:hypothetical protein
MKSVPTKDGYMTLINNPETRVFDKIKIYDFLCVNNLTEAERYNADQLVQRNVLQKVEQNEEVGYRAYSRKVRL